MSKEDRVVSVATWVRGVMEPKDEWVAAWTVHRKIDCSAGIFNAAIKMLESQGYMLVMHRDGLKYLKYGLTGLG